MTGFVATANPAHASSWRLSSIWVSDPYGYSRRSYAATSTPLNSYLETDASDWYDRQWYGKYIVIVPQG